MYMYISFSIIVTIIISVYIHFWLYRCATAYPFYARILAIFIPATVYNTHNTLAHTHIEILVCDKRRNCVYSMTRGYVDCNIYIHIYVYILFNPLYPHSSLSFDYFGDAMRTAPHNRASWRWTKYIFETSWFLKVLKIVFLHLNKSIKLFYYFEKKKICVVMMIVFDDSVLLFCIFIYI